MGTLSILGLLLIVLLFWFDKKVCSEKKKRAPQKLIMPFRCWKCSKGNIETITLPVDNEIGCVQVKCRFCSSINFVYFPYGFLR